MTERSRTHGANDPEVVAFSERNRAALGSTLQGKTVLAVIDALVPILGKMERRIAELEARPMPKWSGPYKAGLEYGPLSFTVHQGALWIAQHKTMDRPGTTDAWRLCCKSGGHSHGR